MKIIMMILLTVITTSINIQNLDTSQYQYSLLQTLLLVVMGLCVIFSFFGIVNHGFNLLLFLFCLLCFFQSVIGLIVMLVILVIIVILGYKYQEKFIYRPIMGGSSRSPSSNPQPYKQPGLIGQDYDNIQLMTEDGVKLKGWIIKHPNPSQIIVFFHGSSKNIGLKLRFMRVLKEVTNSIIVVVAYRGYSDSEGQPTQKGLCYDSKAIIHKTNQYRNTYYPNLEIFIFGRSLGGAVAIYVCSELSNNNIIKGVILENTFTSIGDIIDDTFPYIKPIKHVLRNNWRSIERISSIKVPILFIQSMKDRLIPPKQMRKLRSHAKNSIYTQHHQVENGTHSKCWDIDRKSYFEAINNFLNYQHGK